MGATSSSIVFFLSKEFTKLVLISNLMAWPVAYFAMNKWLQNFAYRITISVLTFLAASAIAFIIALLSVSYQSIKSGLSNPVDALRYE
jgi:putative ABC transport system permease protein